MAVALLASATPVAAAMDTESLFAPSIEVSAASRVSDFETGFEYIDYGSYAEITGYEGDDTEIEIPSDFDGTPVTRIAKGAFADASTYGNLTKITIPETIEYIGANAFAGCTKVTEGYIPSKFIGICAACKEIKVSENVKELVKFEVQDAHKTKVTTSDGLASLYTEYTLDGTTLAERALAVPKAVAQADVDGLTAANFTSFVKKYSTIADVWIYSKECKISDGLIPESAVIHGYRVSTARDYATSKNREFKPIDGEASAEDILNSITLSKVDYQEVANTQKFKLSASAEVGDYSVFRIGILVDRDNQTTVSTAETYLTLDNESNLLNAKKKNATTLSGTVAENGYGLWVRPYIVVDNGSGDESQAVIKYGEPQFIFSEEHVKSEITTGFTATQDTTNDQKVIMLTSSSIENDFYELSETGFVFDRDGVITSEADAKEKLTVDSDFIHNGTGKNTCSVGIVDTGSGVWAVGYTTVVLKDADGQEIAKVTNYSDPIYWSAFDPMSAVSVSADASAVNDVKFKLNVTADAGDYEIVKTGVIYDKSGTVSNVVVEDGEDADEKIKKNVADSLKVDSVYYDARYGEAGSSYSLKVSDAGNGIWYVGYVTVKINGKEETKYSEPQYVYSEVQTEGVDMHMSVTERGKNKAGYDSYRFATVSRVNGETAVESGIIFNRDGVFANKEAAAKSLVLDSSGKSSGNIVASKTTGTITSCIADIGDTGKGIWFVSYIVTEDAAGKRTTKYTEPCFVNNHESAVRANLSVKMASSLMQDSANKYRIDATAVTGEYNVDRVGVIFSRNGEVNANNAVSKLVLGDGGASDKIVTEKPGVNSTGGTITDMGNGIWAIGYVIVQVSDTETVTQYSEPIYVGN